MWTNLYCLRFNNDTMFTQPQSFCKISKMGDASWNLYILVTMAQVPLLATPMVVAGAISRYLALITAFTVKTLILRVGLKRHNYAHKL